MSVDSDNTNTDVTLVLRCFVINPLDRVILILIDIGIVDPLLEEAPLGNLQRLPKRHYICSSSSPLPL